MCTKLFNYFAVSWEFGGVLFQLIGSTFRDRCELLGLRIKAFDMVVCKFIQAFGIHFLIHH